MRAEAGIGGGAAARSAAVGRLSVKLALMGCLGLAAPGEAASAEEAGRKAIAAVPGPAAGTYFLPVIQAAPKGRVLDLAARDRSLAEFTTGKISLLSFMYTYCADPVGCPLVYNTFNALRTRLLASPALARRIRFVSLSFDPAHDTPETLRLYAGNLAAAASPLRWEFLTTASLTQLRPILEGLGQDVQLQSRGDGQPSRFFNHMVKVFLIDARGRVREIYSTAFLHTDIMYNDLLTLAMETQGGGASAPP